MLDCGTYYSVRLILSTWGITKFVHFVCIQLISVNIAQLEGEATSRAIHLAGFVNTPLYVVHVMSIDAMEEIAKARKSGL